MSKQDHATAIAELNDAHRSQPGPGWLMTRGVQALGFDLVGRATAAIRDFSDFGEDNDPHGERDFGAFDLEGRRLFWKIDYYDQDLIMASPDPADPRVTRRILTLMLAEEY